jgi:acetyl/propionyl-CoA carboxylase alpha subunit
MSDKNLTPASGEAFEVRRAPGGAWSVKKGAEAPTEHAAELDSTRIDHRTVRLLAGQGEKRRRLFWIYSQGSKRILSWPGGSIELEAAEAGETSGAGGGKLRPLKLTMPGKVVAVKVKEGDIVPEGSGLVVVEAMKMENLLLAPARAKIAKVHVTVGDRLESGAVLITFESAP